ncbi:MAG: macro domain-containing protein [Gemmatimonadota bacterium]
MISVLIDDLGFFRADAIARPVNGSLRAPTPLMRRFEDACGPALARECRPSSELEVGSAIVTGGFESGAGLLIHAVVITDDEAVSADGVRRATLSALRRAADWDVDHLVLAPFGLGAGNLDAGESAQAMMAGLRAHRQRCSTPRQLTFVVESDYELEAFRSAASRLEAAA